MKGMRKQTVKNIQEKEICRNKQTLGYAAVLFPYQRLAVNTDIQHPSECVGSLYMLNL